MPEADQSVLYSSSKKCDVNVDKKLLKHETDSVFVLWCKQIAMLGCKVRNSAYPAHVESLWIITAIILGLHFGGRSTSYGLIELITGFEDVLK